MALSIGAVASTALEKVRQFLTPVAIPAAADHVSSCILRVANKVAA